MKKLTALVALLCVFGLGMSFALLGAISVKLMPHLGINTSQFGTLILVFMLSCLVMSLIIGLLVDKWGHKPLAIFGFLFTAICIFLIAKATSFGTAVIACVLLGIGAMCLNTVGNTLIPVVLFEGKNPAAASNFGNVFFGLGLFLVPLLLGKLFETAPDAYVRNISIVAIIALVPIIPAIFAEYPPVKTGFEISKGVSMLGQPAVIVAGIALFLYIGLESSVTNWVAPYGKEVIKRLSPDLAAKEIDKQAQYMMSAFAIAMMVGRLVASQFKAITRVGDKVVAVLAVVAAIVLFLMTKTNSVALAWVLVVLVGLSFAPCFPTIVGVTFSKFDQAVYGSVFGMIFAIGLAGAVIIPKLIGKFATGKPIQESLSILIVVAVVLIFFALILGVVRAKGDVAAKPEEAPAEPSGKEG